MRGATSNTYTTLHRCFGPINVLTPNGRRIQVHSPEQNVLKEPQAITIYLVFSHIHRT